MADEQNKQGAKKKRRLFEDISIVQVTATALAAVTSMLLSSYIGIAGSVIGVAVASVVSTTAASLYKHFLKESTEKIKEIPVIDKTHDIIEHMTSAIGKDKHDASDGVDAKEHEQGIKTEEQDPTPSSTARDGAKDAERGSDDTPEEVIPLDELSIQANAITLPISEIEGNETPSPDSALDADTKVVTDGAAADGEALDGQGHAPSQVSPHMEDIEAALRAKKRMKIGLIVVCVVSALIAVALSAVVVYVSSQGQGIGAKPQSIFVPISTPESSEETTNDPLGLFGKNGSSSNESNASSSSPSSSTDDTASSSDSSSEASSSSGSESSSTNTSGDTSTTTPDSSSSDASSSSSSGESTDEQPPA